MIKADKPSSPDKNFDALAERFSKRVYGGLKGDIRLAVLWRDLESVIARLQQKHGGQLRVLDVGSGLSQLAIRLAQAGHKVTVNDVSPVMLAQAKQCACDVGVEQNIEWICAPYQTLHEQIKPNELDAGFHLILCHALLEWLENPDLLIGRLQTLMSDSGFLSLCFYNPAAKVYRNLIRGNFNWLRNEERADSDEGSLTPNHAKSLEQVRSWLAVANLTIESESGLRVFHDYVVEKRGGHQFAEEVLEMELLFSTQEPYKWLGRYLHVLASKNAAE